MHRDWECRMVTVKFGMRKKAQTVNSVSPNSLAPKLWVFADSTVLQFPKFQALSGKEGYVVSWRPANNRRSGTCCQREQRAVFAVIAL